jgi:DNA polymerase III subunit beta
MNITVLKSDLNRILSVTQSAVAKRATMPILSNILLKAEDGHLYLSSSDLEISVVASIKAQIKQPGRTTVNARVFSDVIRELPEGDIKISVGEGERLEVNTKGSKFKIIGKSADEYPELPGVGTATTSKLPAKVLVEMIQKTLYAASVDETRFNLNGVCFESTVGAKGKDKKGEAKLLKLVATDGHRLALMSRPGNGFTFEGRVIVPRKGLSELKKILDLDQEKDVGLAMQDGFLVVETGEFKMAVRLIDGEYPDYSQVIPEGKGEIAKIKSGELIQALRRVMLMVTDREKCVKITFDTELLRISSSSPELGEASEELSVEYAGKALTVGFNALYLLDVASAIAGDGSLAVELHGELGPGKFYADNDESCLAIVMPMRL